MGVSSNACIAYGIDLQDEPPFNDGRDDTDLAAYLAIKQGAVDPWPLVPDHINYGPLDDFKKWEADNAEWRQQQEAWQAATKAAEEASPIVLEYHCSYEYPMYIIALKGTTRTAFRGDPVALPSDFTDLISEKAVTKAQEFCEEYELPAFDNPSWLLYSMWG